MAIRRQLQRVPCAVDLLLQSTLITSTRRYSLLSSAAPPTSLHAVATRTQPHIVPCAVNHLFHTLADEPFWACLFPTLDSAVRKCKLGFVFCMWMHLMKPHSWLIMRPGSTRGGAYSAENLIGEHLQVCIKGGCCPI